MSRLFRLLLLPLLMISSKALTFQQFVEQHGKVYSSAEERATREAIFQENAAHVARFNAHRTDVVLELNQWADLHKHEFAATKLKGSAVPSGGNAVFQVPTTMLSGGLPTAVDWRRHHVVNAPRDQGNCGSCWTFAAIATIESAIAIRSGVLPQLSEQQLVDCATEGAGCDGGTADLAYDYVKDQGLCTEAQYPYTGSAGQCADQGCGSKWRVVSYRDIPGNETALMAAVAQQPVAVGIEADQNVFQFYKGGIIRQGCGRNLDHAVVIVGYGTEAGVPYWIVRNSWGSGWGEGGYVRIARGHNMCGIGTIGSLPHVARVA